MPVVRLRLFSYLSDPQIVSLAGQIIMTFNINHMLNVQVEVAIGIYVYNVGGVTILVGYMGIGLIALANYILN
jgi:hypothetical protein